MLKLAILAWRYLLLLKMRKSDFAFKPLHANMSYDQTSVTTQTSFWLAALERCTKAKVGMYVVKKLDLLIATFCSRLLIQHSHTELQDASVKCTLSYWLTALQHISCLHSAYDGNGASLQHRPMSLNRFCAVFFSSYTTQIQIHNSSMAIVCQVSWHFASTWLQLPPISTCHRFLDITVFM